MDPTNVSIGAVAVFGVAVVVAEVFHRQKNRETTREQESPSEALTFLEYEKRAHKTAKKLKSKQESLNRAALGMAGESGEFADHLKKYLYQGHPLEREELIKEVGDVLWYVAAACGALDVSMEEVAKRNLGKLSERYPDGFKAEGSVRRVDKD